MTLVDLHRLPRHVAIIMDGNGRWAQDQGRIRSIGHREGSRAVRRTVRAARRLGVDALTLFAFSEQNWHRPGPEVAALMELLREYLISEREELMENGIRLRAVGRVDKLPSSVRDVLDALVADTAHLDGMTLTLALSYGGREELVDAARALASEVAAGRLTPDAIDEAALEAHVPSVDVGRVDLLIRTGGEQRISNFLLWGAAYAELHFTPRLWPEFEAEDLYQAIRAFQSRQRRFGRVTTLHAEPEPISSAGE
ncbi:MAG TPA: polyprenyl diphosphate synthase [Polyangiaceae bacterium LLY-WYZ-15_(1-7)]|mgnify:CR=1 FL=1|nr:polyprenyl diphosphate synthase [Polyangiaceae bacterium LLY-WYZ-15_(1-7)]HJL03119.1 polyprenyl diphosphate synthase [Polyangiaceae bacterium LLY-WYZ-15_(1-7)]HJL08101.1 polyprenyl diphosphate synthase [Polyangiaceae bacterium LLY-WYZ-15_(1-7)]HJL24031.1 polyprenyl diphosphate synthase [Polyangiaceae bacterium LLY-WYZ-15_(1-7)]HJL33454.1 polyprenyl diphosphate synthase [Polyangiaceae bacterium LLY-WYZ-15_(1-7)]